MPENQISQTTQESQEPIIPSVKPQKLERNWWKILGFTLLGLVFASGIFAAGYFTALKAQSAKIIPLPTPTPTPQPISQTTPTPAPTDNRILLTPENQNQYWTPTKGCDEEFNHDPANTTTTYSNQVKGISLEIPYNHKWGSNKYRINPYDERETMGEMLPDSLEFGSIGLFEACSWARSHFLYFRPAKSADEVINEIKKDPNYPEMFSLQPKKIVINGLEVVKYENFGLCSYPTLQIIGKKYNYELKPLCDGESFQFFEDIIKTIKLID